MTSGHQHTPIQSLYADDPEMAELVQLFVSELPDLIASVQTAWKCGKLDELTRLAHQLKGAGSGYGYPSISRAAGELERELRGLPAPSAVAEVRDELETLIDVCRRAMHAAH